MVINFSFFFLLFSTLMNQFNRGTYTSNKCFNQRNLTLKRFLYHFPISSSLKYKVERLLLKCFWKVVWWRIVLLVSDLFYFYSKKFSGIISFSIYANSVFHWLKITSLRLWLAHFEMLIVNSSFYRKKLWYFWIKQCETYCCYF